MNREYNNKIAKIREVILRRQIEGILITNLSNFAWLTGGRGYISIAFEKTSCQVLVTRMKVYFITNNIEAERFKNEELQGLEGEYMVHPWQDGSKREELLKDIAPQGRIENDDALANEFKELRSVMTGEELERYRWLGRTAARATEKVAREITIGCTEYEAWGMLTAEALRNCMEPATVLVAFDRRAFDYRHPVPTENKLEKYAMLVTGFRKWGLNVSCTRFVSFGKLDPGTRDRFQAISKIDTAFILSTRPGVKAGDIFKEGLKMYQATGYEDEWRNHHQGGLTGYGGREFIATETTEKVVQVNQVYAWNPSIPGAKSEDTFIVGSQQNEIITHTGEYEYIDAEYNGVKLQRPYVLIR